MKNKINIIFIFYTFLIIIALTLYYSQGAIFVVDDLNYTLYDIYHTSVFDCLVGDTANSLHGGKYLGLFFARLFSCKLPVLLNIHPSDFITYGHGFIKGIFSCTALFLIAGFFKFFSHSDKNIKSFYDDYFFVIFFLTASLFFVFVSNSVVMTFTYNYYRYFFSLIFLAIFYYFISQAFLKNKITDNKFLICFVCFSAFVLGTAIEPAWVASAFFVFFILILDLLKEKKLNYKIIFPASFLLIGITQFMNSGFMEIIQQRGISKTHFLNENWLALLKEYIPVFFNFSVTSYLPVIIIFLICVIYTVVCIYKKRTGYKEFLCGCLIALSVWFAFFSLILCGKPEETDNTFFIAFHPNLFFLYRMMFLIPLFYFISFSLYFLIPCLKEKNLIKPFEAVFTIGLLFFASFLYFKYFDFYVFYKNEMVTKRRNLYIAEKFIRFYFLKKKPVYLPKNLKSDFLSEFNEHSLVYENGGLKRHLNPAYIARYILFVYKSEEANFLKCYFVDDYDSAVQNFYREGGTIHPSELVDIKFQNLYDEKFVLNKKTVNDLKKK